MPRKVPHSQFPASGNQQTPLAPRRYWCNVKHLQLSLQTAVGRSGKDPSSLHLASTLSASASATISTSTPPFLVSFCHLHTVNAIVLPASSWQRTLGKYPSCWMQRLIRLSTAKVGPVIWWLPRHDPLHLYNGLINKSTCSRDRPQAGSHKAAVRPRTAEHCQLRQFVTQYPTCFCARFQELYSHELCGMLLSLRTTLPPTSHRRCH